MAIYTHMPYWKYRSFVPKLNKSLGHPCRVWAASIGTRLAGKTGTQERYLAWN